ncbi:TPA: pilus assembly protein [Vibrio vulnificus]|uniref:TadE/TadG family type IV pilus assembly protein n=1 Tax=Vibrio vulnificus TaxID=672 RepID=UPI0028CAF29D|nr:pilus assembly protein [Vibrio vulnificus]
MEIREMKREMNNQKVRGFAAVEMVATLPVILLILVGVVEVGHMFTQYNTLAKGVQNGARFAVNDVYGTITYDQIANEADIKNMVLHGQVSGGSYAILDNLTADDITVTHNSGYVTVTASYTYVPSFSKIPYTNTELGITFTASSVMRSGL